MKKLQSIASVRGVGKIVQSYKDFYNDLLELKQNNASLITPAQEMIARIATAGKENIGSYCGTWTAPGFEYARGAKPILRLNSRLLDLGLAKQAVEANRQRIYFSTENQNEYEQDLETAKKQEGLEPKERTALILPSRKDFNITPSQSFEVLEFLARDKDLAKEYFKFNKERSITTYLINPNTIDAQNGTILTQLWLCRFGVDDGSEFYGYYRSLYCDGRARGVLKKSAEGTSQKILPYTSKDVKVAEKELKDLSRFLQPEKFIGLKTLVEKLRV